MLFANYYKFVLFLENTLFFSRPFALSHSRGSWLSFAKRQLRRSTATEFFTPSRLLSLNTLSNYDNRHHRWIVICFMKSIYMTLTRDECCQNCDSGLHLLWNISHLMLEVFKGLAACGLCMKLERVVTILYE